MKQVLQGKALIQTASATAALLAAVLLGTYAFASSRPVEGYGPFRLYQNIPRMQQARFLPKYSISGHSLDSYEEKFESGRMIKTYRCVEELPCASKQSIPSLLTLTVVDGKLLNILIETDFTAEVVSTAAPAPKPAVGSSTTAARPAAETPEPESQEGGAWEARKKLAGDTFIYQINYLYDRYLGKKPQNEDLTQFFDGDGPHYVSDIRSEGSDKEWITLTFFPESPLLTLEVSTKAWEEIRPPEPTKPAAEAGPSPYETKTAQP